MTETTLLFRKMRRKAMNKINYSISRTSAKERKYKFRNFEIKRAEGVISDNTKKLVAHLIASI